MCLRGKTRDDFWKMAAFFSRTSLRGSRYTDPANPKYLRHLPGQPGKYEVPANVDYNLWAGPAPLRRVPIRGMLIAEHAEVPAKLALQGFHAVCAYSAAPDIRRRLLEALDHRLAMVGLAVSTFIAALAILVMAQPAGAQTEPRFDALVFSKTTGFRHTEAINAGHAAIARAVAPACFS